MRAQRKRARVLWLKLRHEFRPEQASGAQFRNFHEEVHADSPEERDAWCKSIDLKPCVEPGAHIFKPIGERVGELKILRRPGFLHVITRYRNRIELRHVRSSKGEDIGDDAQ